MIITLTSDFGTADHYVAAMKAAILRHCPAATLIDITHQIAPQDITAASFTLDRAVASFDPGTIHLAVIDPTVGSPRRILLARVSGQLILCPDNGLITWTVRRAAAPPEFAELTWRPTTPISTTFHGRDIMAPAAGLLAAGTRIDDLAKPITNPVLLDLHLSAGPAGQIIHIDHFGNATTSLPSAAVRATTAVRLPSGRALPIVKTYADAAPGQPLALVGSSDLIEIAVNAGSAAQALALHVGDTIELA